MKKAFLHGKDSTGTNDTSQPTQRRCKDVVKMS